MIQIVTYNVGIEDRTSTATKSAKIVVMNAEAMVNHKVTGVYRKIIAALVPVFSNNN